MSQENDLMTVAHHRKNDFIGHFVSTMVWFNAEFTTTWRLFTAILDNININLSMSSQNP